MNILHRVTRRMLGKNPTRTWVTIIGIMLSMALTVAVLEGAYSGLQFLVNIEGKTDGYYQGYYYGLDADGANAAVSQREIKNSATWELVGWAETDPENPAGRPRICVDALGSDPNGLVAIRLADGRMPENDSELLLPADWFMDGDLTRTELQKKIHDALGTTVTLTLGKRAADNGDPLTEKDEYRFADGEKLTDTAEHSYTVVGVYRDLDRFIENSRFCYRAFTVGQGIGEYRVFFTLNLPSGFKAFVRNQGISDRIVAHSSMLRYWGVSDNALIVALYGLAGVLVGLVAFGSISLIYNSFSISVSERTRQYGILRSIGATKKQIRAMVRHEALLLGLAGTGLGMILGLAGIGITLWGISPMLQRMLNDPAFGEGVRMRLVISPVMLIISALVCLLTTLISAWLPARRAVRINTIDAIRQSSDVKMSPREVRTSKLTQKLFGFEGVMASKNFKRNRRRYRSTVLSLFLSIVLFISASSLTSYLQNSVNEVAGEMMSADLVVFYYGGEMEADVLHRRLMQIESVTEGGYLRFYQMTELFKQSDLSEEYRSAYGVESEDGMSRENKTIAFADDTTFRTIAKESGQDPDAFFTGEPQALFVNTVTARVWDESRKQSVYKTIRIVEPEAFPMQVKARTNPIEDDRIVLDTDWGIPEGALAQLGAKEGVVVLCDPAALERVLEPDENGMNALGRAVENFEQTGTFDASVFGEDAIRVVPESEVYRFFDLTLAAPCSAQDLSLPTRGAILYPYSRLPEVLDAETAAAENAVTLFYRSGSHAAAAEAMKAFGEENRLHSFTVNDMAENFEMERLMITIVNIFAYGFIILISLIAVANVFNTISTNIMLRRREFAMLKSIGLSEKGFRKMMNYECVIYGLKGLLWGLPVSVLVTYLIWYIMRDAIDQPFYLPWHSVAIAVGSVFAVVFATMLYATQKIRRDNPIDALKNENL